MKIQHIITDAGMVNAGGEFRLAADVIFARLEDGTARLFDMSGSFYALSESAACLVEDALRMPVQDAAAAVAEEFGAESLEVERDLHELLDDLRRRGSLRPAAEPSKARGRRRWAGALLHPLLRGLLAAPLSLRVKARLLLALAFFSHRWCGWTTTIVTWRKASAFEHPKDPAGAQIEAVSHCVREQAGRSWLNVECKEISLCSWALLRRLGVRPELFVGVELYPFGAHAWCEAGGTVMADTPDRCLRYTPVLCCA